MRSCRVLSILSAPLTFVCCAESVGLFLSCAIPEAALATSVSFVTVYAHSLPLVLGVGLRARSVQRLHLSVIRMLLLALFSSEAVC